MHEFSMAAGIVEAVSEFAAAHPDKTILKVTLQVGEFACVEASQLKFCFESIVENTDLNQAKLEIEIVLAAVKCVDCGYEGAPQYWTGALTVSVPTLQCPRCGGPAIATAGHECAIKTVQLAPREYQTTF